MDLSRTRALIGAENLEKIRNATVAVAGLGGVGGYAAEALCRSGIGRIILIDGDTVSESNLNRQLFATTDTLGMEKPMAAEKRLSAVNPETRIITRSVFLTADNISTVTDSNPDFVIDAIDNVTAKLALAISCRERGIGLVSSMGAGNRLDPTAFRRGWLSDTAGCGDGLARVMRREARKRGIENLRVVYSTELPIIPTDELSVEGNGKHPPASAGWVVGAAGLALAAEAIEYIIK